MALRASRRFSVEKKAVHQVSKIALGVRNYDFVTV
jgi:hypothetical protein